jgi:hypothetical protein
MEHQTPEVFSTEVVEYERFGGIAVSVGEQVFIYRRLQDAYDKSLVAVVNDRNDTIGYLDRDFATSHVIPSLRKGVRFECVVDGEPSDDRVPLKVRPVAQSEVETILSRPGSRRTRSDGVSPLAGLFEPDEDPEDVDDANIGEIDDEIALFDDDDIESDAGEEE